MSPEELDSYAEVMTRRGITEVSFDGICIKLPARLASATAPTAEPEKPRRINGVDAALRG